MKLRGLNPDLPTVSLMDGRAMKLTDIRWGRSVLLAMPGGRRDAVGDAPAYRVSRIEEALILHQALANGIRGYTDKVRRRGLMKNQYF